MSLSIFTHSNAEIVKKNAQEKLLSLCATYAHIPILFLSSGGSAFSLLNNIHTSLDYSHIYITVVDERFSKDPSINNFLQLQKTDLYTHILKSGGKSINTLPQNGENLSESGYRFEKNLKTWKSENTKGIVIISLGMGEDGHTAGIMPYPENKEEFKKLFEQNTWVVSYNAGNKNQYKERITTTLHFLREYVDEAVVFITGNSKQEAFNRLMSSEGQLHITPARIIHEMKQVSLFTDRT